MKRLCMTALASIAGLAAAQATELKQVGSIPVPGGPLKTYDIPAVDQRLGRYYLTDRSNASLDIFDVKAGSFLKRVAGFVGQKDSNDVSGPNGVTLVGKTAWVSDGDSSIKIVDLASGKITDTIALGGKARTDSVAYDPKDQIVAGVNNADDPPFITFVSTRLGHKIVGKVEFKGAGDGAEQPLYEPALGMFVLAIPQLADDKTKGGVAVLDPRKATLIRMMPVNDCAPAGLVRGPGEQLLLGCQAGDKDHGVPPQTVVIDIKTGAEMARIKGIGGSDLVAYDPGAKLYYTGSRDMPNGPAVGVIDARDDTLVQTIAMPPGSNPHSVAVYDANHHVLVPESANVKGGCGGCVAVFAPQ